MAGRPKNSIDHALATAVATISRERSLSVRDVSAAMGVPKSTLHRLLSEGTVSQPSREAVARWLNAVDTSPSVIVKKTQKDQEIEIMGQILSMSQKFNDLLKQLDVLMREARSQKG